MIRAFHVAALALAVSLLADDALAAKVGEQVQRTGDEIMVCGQLYHTTAPVVLWTDPGGYDAYRVERRSAPLEKADWRSTVEDLPDFRSGGPARYGMRLDGLSADEVEQVRGGGWPLPMLQKVVDQFVIHYDVCPVSQTC